MTKTLSILGVTGSIGQSTIDVLMQTENDDAVQVKAIASGRDAEGLAKAAIDLNVEFAAIGDDSKLDELRQRLKNTNIKCGAGKNAVLDAASLSVDISMAAISGTAGLEPTLSALRAGNDVLLANKESMVCAGPFVKRVAEANDSKIIPVDSEHNAIFQVMHPSNPFEKITLTASGGPFREANLGELKNASVEDALNHPNWSMGAKNSLDSATMMNKGLELIEAAYLFDLPEEKIDVLVHPQSIIHAMVSYSDGSVLAQLGVPDMRTPIAYALSWPDRLSTKVEPLDLAALGALTFHSVDEERFPAIQLARNAVRAGPVGSCLYNAANEFAGNLFLNGKVGFLQISEIVARVMDKLEHPDGENLPDDIRCLEDTVMVSELVAKWVSGILKQNVEFSR